MIGFNLPIFDKKGKISSLFTLGALIITGTAATTQSAFAGTVFKDLGNLGDPDNNWHFSLGLSDDGSVITGTSRRDPLTQEAFRWTAELGMEGLGFLPGGGSFSVGWAISGDGSTIVGRSDTASGDEAFRWTETDGMQGLGHLLGGGSFSEANGVSFDGSVIVGSSDTASGEEAFYWTEPDGMQGLGHLSDGGLFSTAFGVSAEGSIVVGQSDNASGLEAFRWTEPDGMQGLGSLPGGGSESIAEGISANGKFIVGGAQSANSGSDFEAFLWSEETRTMIGLGDLPGGTFSSSANAISADGSVVVGNSNIGLPEVPGEPLFSHAAFIWDEVNGIRNLQEILENELGLDFRGITLHSATDISIEGDLINITGWGTIPDVIARADKERAVAIFSAQNIHRVPEPSLLLSLLTFASLGLWKKYPQNRLRN